MNIGTSCNTFELAVNISLKLPLIRNSDRVGKKENLQKLVFPKGISYYHLPIIHRKESKQNPVKPGGLPQYGGLSVATTLRKLV
jgi:hypothetical protein